MCLALLTHDLSLSEGFHDDRLYFYIFSEPDGFKITVMIFSDVPPPLPL